MTEYEYGYEYHSASQKWINTIYKNEFCPKRKASKTISEAHTVMLNSPSPLITRANYKCKQLPIHMTHPIWLWYMKMNYSFGAQSSFCSAEYPKKNKHPLIFFKGLVDPVIRKVKVWWQIFMCQFIKDWGPLIKSINAQQNIYSIQKKFQAVFGLRKSPKYEYK